LIARRVGFDCRQWGFQRFAIDTKFRQRQQPNAGKPAKPTGCNPWALRAKDCCEMAQDRLPLTVLPVLPKIPVIPDRPLTPRNTFRLAPVAFRPATSVQGSTRANSSGSSPRWSTATGLGSESSAGASSPRVCRRSGNELASGKHLPKRQVIPTAAIQLAFAHDRGGGTA
jgi:hypothetical protein